MELKWLIILHGMINFYIFQGGLILFSFLKSFFNDNFYNDITYKTMKLNHQKLIINTSKNESILYKSLIIKYT